MKLTLNTGEVLRIKLARDYDGSVNVVIKGGDKLISIQPDGTFLRYENLDDVGLSLTNAGEIKEGF